ncbi:hypothetical protein QTP86_005035 [Hemibagrus guttatus]|nr:hypothetical protein QTP86_005035 [Hemibagrus guttatus]
MLPLSSLEQHGKGMLSTWKVGHMSPSLPGLNFVVDMGVQSKHWVLLAAGSTGWKDYNHQANVCHAYQVIHQNGIPDEQIVVMMYDDIAHNEKNPDPGKIINVPNGPNVYTGVPKDYTGEDVSAENFLAVLRGDSSAVKKTGPKKVIQREAATNGDTTDLEEYTSMTSYISKCINDVTISKSITTLSNQKPWMTAKVRALLKSRDSAFRAGDKDALRTALAKVS